MKLRKRNKLVFGIGINDADYPVTRSQVVDEKCKIIWTCPFYVKWVDMLRRCYSLVCQQKRPTYVGCEVTESWLTFSNFRVWMDQQDWLNKNLDKDILLPGNKLYSPETCVFVDAKVNTFLLDHGIGRGDLPIGVCWNKKLKKFMAQCRPVGSKNRGYLGLFTNPEDAHQAWLAFKLEQAYILAAEQTDERVAEALISRYQNYNKG